MIHPHDIAFLCGLRFDTNDHLFSFELKMTKADAGETLNLAAKAYTPLLSKYRSNGANANACVPVSDIEDLATRYSAAVELHMRSGLSAHRIHRIIGQTLIASPAGYDLVKAEQIIFSDDTRLLPRRLVHAVRWPVATDPHGRSPGFMNPPAALQP